MCRFNEIITSRDNEHSGDEAGAHMLYGVQEVDVHAGTAKDAPPEKPRNYLGNDLRYFRMGLCEIEGQTIQATEWRVQDHCSYCRRLLRGVEDRSYCAH
jgi:hypothetical protein